MLVATGSLYRVQPQRVVCKRIVLSGHPYKINKRSAVIRYMFFNRGEGLDAYIVTVILFLCRGHTVVQASGAENKAWLSWSHQGTIR